MTQKSALRKAEIIVKFKASLNILFLLPSSNTLSYTYYINTLLHVLVFKQFCLLLMVPTIPLLLQPVLAFIV